MRTKIYYPLMMAAAIIAGLSSCKKDAQTTTTTKTSTGATTTTSVTTAVTATEAIAITALASTTTTHDSLYVIGCFPPKGGKGSVAFSALPSAVGTYLTANYSGYTFQKAFEVTDSTKAINGYVVIIKYNSQLIGLKFTAAGVFVSVLEQRSGPELQGPGFQPGGPFGDRGAPAKDTIAISALPTAVTTFFSTTYPSDTLLHAGINPDSTYALISKDNGLFVTVVTAAGKLVNRVEVNKGPGPQAPVAQSALLGSITTYLTATYPGYVFNKAFGELKGTTVQDYVVFITANSTSYAVKFDATGKFINAIVIR